MFSYHVYSSEREISVTFVYFFMKNFLASTIFPKIGSVTTIFYLITLNKFLPITFHISRQLYIKFGIADHLIIADL
jgi:hypothetical protein